MQNQEVFSEIESRLNLMLDDSKSIQILSTEVSEKVDGADYSKLHAIYEIAENGIRMNEEIFTILMKYMFPETVQDGLNGQAKSTG